MAEPERHRGQPLHKQQQQRLHGDEQTILLRLRLCGIAASHCIRSSGSGCMETNVPHTGALQFAPCHQVTGIADSRCSSVLMRHCVSPLHESYSAVVLPEAVDWHSALIAANVAACDGICSARKPAHAE